MALAKGSTNTTTVEDIFPPKVARKKGAMTVAPGAMGIIVDRLIDMYRFPVESTVREVVSNAIDALMKLPPEERQAVRVTSPTVESPYLVVEDFGIGMSPQVIEENLLNFGGSFNKRENFDQLGAYGLGAKAPLAYTNEFFVTSVCKGELTEVTVTRDNYGNEWELVTHETTKPSGTRVTIPVRSEDFLAFSETLNSYRYYSRDVEVVIDGQTSTFDEDLVYLDRLLLTEHEDKTTGAKTPVYGDVWVNREALLSRPRNTFALPWNVDFLLSGWLYRGHQEGDTSFTKAKGMVVELKPGVLDYSSSRDDIVQNERFSALNSRLQSNYSLMVQGRLNGAFFQKLFAAYKTFDTREALLFARNYLLRLNDEGEVITALLNSPMSLGVKLDALTTSEDFNPLDLKSVPQASVNIFGALGRRVQGKNSFFTLLSLSTPKTERIYQRLYFTSSDHLTVTEIQTKLEEGLSSLSTDQPLLGYAFSHYLNSGHYNISAGGKFAVIEGANADFLKLMKSQRKLLMEALPDDALVLLSRGAVTTYDKEVTKLLMREPLTILSADKLTEQVMAAKAALKEPREVVPKVEKIPALYLGQPSSTTEEVARLAAGTCSSHHTTVEEACSLGHVILVRSAHVYAPSSLAPLLNGLANAGVQTQGHQVIAVEEKHLRAADFKRLATYPSVYLTHQLKTSMRAAEPLKARKGLVKNDDFLDSAVQEAPLSVLLHAFLTTYRIRYTVNYSSLVSLCQEMLKLDDSCAAVRLLVENPLTSSEDKERVPRATYMVEGLMKRKVGEDVYRELLALRETVTYFSKDGYPFGTASLEQSAIAAALFAKRTSAQDEAIFAMLLPMAAQTAALTLAITLKNLEEES